jgi:trehalose 6-phosphate phosphatase
MIVDFDRWFEENLAGGGPWWFFLDYDGTLAELAPTPDHVTADPEVVALVSRLAKRPDSCVGVISGRRLDHVERLVPVSGALLAGTYGVEMRLFNGERVERVDYQVVRPILDVLKPQWEALVEGRERFFLEDKGWSLALHARFVADEEAEEVLTEARLLALDGVARGGESNFRILGGHKFLEVGPRLAHKGKTVRYLLGRYPCCGARPVYLGDDGKDEEAFGEIKAHGGISIVVSSEEKETRADYRVASPWAVRRLLGTILNRLEAHEGQDGPF